MNADRQSRVEQLVEAALQLEQGQRNEFLTRECAGDQDLLREVESLLAFSSSADNFMEAPALQVAAKVLADRNQASQPPDDAHVDVLVGQNISHL